MTKNPSPTTLVSEGGRVTISRWMPPPHSWAQGCGGVPGGGVPGRPGLAGGEAGEAEERHAVVGVGATASPPDDLAGEAAGAGDACARLRAVAAGRLHAAAQAAEGEVAQAAAVEHGVPGVEPGRLAEVAVVPVGPARRTRPGAGCRRARGHRVRGRAGAGPAASPRPPPSPGQP